MTDEEKKAVAWWERMTDDELKQRILEAYRLHLTKMEDLKALGFKWGVGE